MFVIDSHALQTVHFLDFVHQVARKGHFALDPQNILGNSRIAHQGFAGFDVIALIHIDVFAARNQILFFVTDVHR